MSISPKTQINHENFNQLSDFLLKRNIENFINCTFDTYHPLTDKTIEYINLPQIGDHLKTPRTGYTHHGIYIGKKRVIHYSGLSDGLSSGPIKEISLHEFTQNKGFSIISHPNSKYSPENIVLRAYERVGENKYNLIFNNCEHFTNYCIDGVSESFQVKGASGVINATISGSLKNTNPFVSIGTSIVTSSKYLLSYIKGDISKEKLLEETSDTVITSFSTTFYASFGQATIPIPILGALIGAGVGYFIGNTLLHSGLIALGEAPVVKEARKRREKVKLICDTLIPIIRENRKKLEEYINKYFLDRKKIFNESFNMIDLGVENNDIDSLINGLEKINSQFDKSLSFKNLEDFEDFMLSK